MHQATASQRARSLNRVEGKAVNHKLYPVNRGLNAPSGERRARKDRLSLALEPQWRINGRSVRMTLSGYRALELVRVEHCMILYIMIYYAYHARERVYGERCF